MFIRAILGVGLAEFLVVFCQVAIENRSDCNTFWSDGARVANRIYFSNLITHAISREQNQSQHHILLQDIRGNVHLLRRVAIFPVSLGLLLLKSFSLTIVTSNPFIGHTIVHNIHRTHPLPARAIFSDFGWVTTIDCGP